MQNDIGEPFNDHTYAHLKVDSVSCMLKELIEQVIIIVVLEFPPRESWRILVSFESLYGVWPLPSTRALITLPNADRLLLIVFAAKESRNETSVWL